MTSNPNFVQHTDRCSDADANTLKTQLQLEPHPEGGYYRQLYGNDATGKKTLFFNNSHNLLTSLSD